jgi:hypothetical protein
MEENAAVLWNCVDTGQDLKSRKRLLCLPVSTRGSKSILLAARIVRNPGCAADPD